MLQHLSDFFILKPNFKVRGSHWSDDTIQMGQSEPHKASSPHLSKSVQDIWLKFEQRVCATFKSYQSQINSEHEFNEIKFLLR